MLGSKCLIAAAILASVYGNCIDEDCVFTKWSEWAGCTCAICDDTGETKQSCFRTRNLLEHSDGCQNECREVFQSGCIGQCCNDFCAVTDWSQWSICSCSESGLIGNQFRNRTGIDGKCSLACDITSEERNCDDVCCPTNCQLGEWSDWSECTVECSHQVGYTTRERDMVQGTCGGDMCSLFDATEVRTCNGDCRLSDWSTWNCTCEQCLFNSTDIYEHCVRSRTANCSLACGDLIEESCLEGNCCDPDCDVSSWSTWSDCSVPCDSTDTGVQIRFRSGFGQCSGQPCQHLEDTRSCNSSCCAHDCIVGEWGVWTACTAVCESDVGTQVRTRHVTQGSCGGSMCGEDEWHDVRACLGACRMNTWSEWVCLCSSCNENDPEGRYRECSRRREETNPNICNNDCGSLFEYKCEGNCCDELCVVGEWSEWTDCNAPCGINTSGNITRTRQPSDSCIAEPCDPLMEIKECTSSYCCPQDCVIYSWESWSPCSSECSVEDGTRVRYRSFIQGECNGILCTEGDRFEIESCQGECNISNWSEWSCDCQACSERNESAMYSYCARNRTVPVDEECSICDEYETICKDFEEECCDELCTADEWSSWTTCSVECESYNNGTQERTRQLSESCVGRPCFDIYNQRVCGDECCPENCTLGTWGEWSVCTSECSIMLGSQVRFRDIFQGSCGGHLCVETDNIDVRGCYGGCEVSFWSEWTCVCSSCLANNSTLYNDCLRTRTEINNCELSNPCGSLFERSCLDECCDEVCNLSPWTEWTACSAECMSDGLGFQFRQRSIDESCMSDPCEILFENRTCTASECCPYNCTLGEWETWAECSSICNNQAGFRVRYRDYNQGTCGGTMCTDDDAYEVDTCRGNCTLTSWTAWSCMCELCSDDDDKLHDSCIRQRSQVDPNKCIDSDVCGTLVERGCFDVCCDQFCAVTEWEEWSECSAPCDTDDIGEQTRQRSPLGFCQGDPCSNLTETRSCVAGCCPVDCVMGDWTEWFGCSSSCQHVVGQQVRARDIEQAYCGGINCTVDDNYETRYCHGTCVLTEWSSWNCSCAICDPNDINFHEECFRTRLEVNPDVCNNECGDLMESTCSADDCCDKYCELSAWTAWSECDASCGVNATGVISRQRQPIAACFSHPCVEVYESRECFGPECCPEDCQLGEWSLWSSCSSLCSNKSGLTYRVREVFEGICGGKLCPKNAGINITSCYGNCSLSEWTEWDCKCNFCDGDGVLKNDCIRTRAEIVPEFCYGESCGSLVERVCSDQCCDEFCLLSEWSNWSPCSINCSISTIATKERKREAIIWCLSPPCNATTDISTCDDICCPQDCVLGNWNDWLPCSAKCSDTLGTQTRERRMTQGSCGGTMCSEEAPYDTRVCYGECEVNNWSDWYCNCTHCNPQSDKLYHNCSRERSAALSGYCSEHCTTMEFKCDEQCCDNSCNVTTWSGWTECTALCGLNSTAVQERYRNYSASCLGVPCSDIYESRTCYSAECCPVNCSVGTWSEWTVCSADCSSETGMQHRIREIQNGSCGGALCNETDNHIERRECVGECLVSEWTSWNCECGYCGNSNYSRQNCSRERHPSNLNMCLTTECHFEENICGDVCCDNQCILDEWTNWSNCSKPCDSPGTGFAFRDRNIVNECDADPCDIIHEERECTSSCCPQDCEIGIWSTWSQCNVHCYFEVGVHFRTRDLFHSKCGGRRCTNNTDVYQVQQCSGPCSFSEWSEWICECAPCNTTETLYRNCTRTRNESNLDFCRENCGHTVESECSHPCCDPGCDVTDWTTWSVCDLECGEEGLGEQTRFRSVIVESCLAEPCVKLIDVQNCTSECCPVDCSISTWTAWSNCSTHCSVDVGNKRRTRIITEAECGGVECVDLNDEEISECNGTCVLSEWSQWSCACAFCITGNPHLHNLCTRSRNESPECVDFEPCGALQQESCGEECCDDFCFVGEWSEWTECTTNCVIGNVGTQSRSRSQISQLCLGPPCESLVENRSCNSTCCPRNCTVLDWSDWSRCSSECSAFNGTRQRSRDFIQGSCGGDLCPNEITEIDTCTSECVLSEWSAWACQCNFCSLGDSFLSTVCSRNRDEIGGECNGKCGNLTEVNCNQECCDEFCFVGEWTPWSRCNVTCDANTNGIRIRTRQIVSNFCLGAPCENLEESEVCHPACCPLDCSVSEWSPWGECSASCTVSAGVQMRTRNVTEATCGGECIIDLSKKEERNCTGDCQLSEWSSWGCSCVFCKPESLSLYRHCERTRTEDGNCDGQCGSLVEEQCIEPCCDEFCATDDWSSWSECNSGVSTRNRNVVSAFCFGDPCGGIIEENVCDQSCCIYTEWTPWSNCSTLCSENVGSQSRIRFLDSTCREDFCNQTTEEVRSCNGDCQPSSWSLWACTCSFCRPGSQLLFNNCHRSRTDVSSDLCFNACGPLEETNCSTECCDEFCFWSEWNSWSLCQQGGRLRTRVQSSIFCIGAPCGSDIETEACFSSVTETPSAVGTPTSVGVTTNSIGGTTTSIGGTTTSVGGTTTSVVGTTTTVGGTTTSVVGTTPTVGGTTSIVSSTSFGGITSSVAGTTTSVGGITNNIGGTTYHSVGETTSRVIVDTTVHVGDTTHYVTESSTTFGYLNTRSSVTDTKTNVDATTNNIDTSITDDSVTISDTATTISQTESINVCSFTHWSTWSGCYPSCNDNDQQQSRYRQLAPVTCNNTQCIKTEEETRECQGTFQRFIEFDVHKELVTLHNITSGTSDDHVVSSYFTFKSMRQRLLIRDKHLAAFGYTLDEYLTSITSTDTYTCLNLLLEDTIQSTSRMLHDLSTEIYDAESFLEILIPLSNQEILEVQEQYIQENNASLLSNIANGWTDGAVERLSISLLLGMRSETKVSKIIWIKNYVNLIFNGNDVDIQSVLAIRSFEDIQRINDEFTMLYGDLSEFLTDSANDDIYTIGYTKIVEYAKSRIGYWTTVIHRLINAIPFPTRQVLRVLTQRVEIDLHEINRRYQESYGLTLEDAINDNYNGPCIEQIISVILMNSKI